MDDKTFWALVAEVNWPKLCQEKKPYDMGKKVLLKHLPTFEDSESFREVLNAKLRQLEKALNLWEREGGRSRSFGVSDDGFSDLTNHIVGCGQEHYEAVLKDPSLAHARAQARHGSPDGYTESFAYCLPYKEDYDSAEIKLKRTEDGLNYWIEKLVADPDYSVNKSEVERRTREVAVLRAEVHGVADTNIDELVKQKVTEITREVRQRQVAILEEEVADAQKRLKKARKALASL